MSLMRIRDFAWRVRDEFCLFRDVTVPDVLSVVNDLMDELFNFGPHRWIMTEFQRSFVIMAYRKFVVCCLIGCLASGVSNWLTYDETNATTITEFNVWYRLGKTSAFLVSIPFLCETRWELKSVRKKRYATYALILVMTFCSIGRHNSRQFWNPYRLSLMAISGLAVLAVGKKLDTYNKFLFLSTALGAVVASLFASASIFVTAIGYVSLRQHLNMVLVITIAQLLHVDITNNGDIQIESAQCLHSNDIGAVLDSNLLILIPGGYGRKVICH